jgi:uncharacterized membrane protein YhaH (DUF805 family)
MQLSKEQSAVWLRRYHAASVVGWLVMIPVSIWTGLWHSVAFVTLISLWALVSTEMGAWQGSRAEVAVVEQASTVEHADVVEKAGS